MPRNPNNPRAQPFTVDEISEIVERLRNVAAALKGIRHTMETRDMKEINVQGGAMMERGFDAFSKFVGNCEKELRDF